MAEKWIQKAHVKKGALHRALGVPEGQKIPAGMIEKASHMGGHMAKMANFAKNTAGLAKGRGK